MSRSSEIESILKLLEEGKINSAQAKDLIDAVSDESEKTENKESKANYRFYERPSNDNFSFDRLSDIGNEIKDAVFDQLGGIKADVFESMSFDKSDNINLSGLESKEIEFDLEEMAKITIEGKNGSLCFRRNPSDKVKLTVAVKPSDFHRIDELVTVAYTSSSLEVSVAEDYSSKIVIVLMLPDKIFKSVKAETTNGNVICWDLKCEDIQVETSNGSFTMKRCRGNSLKAETSNGTVSTEQNDFFGSINIETSNGSIHTNGDSSKSVDLETTNGSIKLQRGFSKSFTAATTNGTIIFNGLRPYRNEGNYLIQGETTNGSINVNIPSEYGAAFECETGKQGNIRLGNNFVADSIQRNNIGRICYAKGESRYAYKSNIIAGVQAETTNGTIALNFGY
ncbi:MAG: DUF4097 family beta strand repeat-containing protein [Clostridia bacterium]|jgi:DUF4097 and DUF4098 domain-containing protein YvlB